MSNKQGEGLYTDRDSFNPQVNAIPLSDADARAKGEGSIGDLVKDASAQISSLVRSEIELAKTEVATSAKKAGIGGGLFAAAAVILAYSSFFLFFTIAEALDTFLPRWLAFLIVFLFMLVLVGVLALVGLKQIKGVKKPEKTIASVNDLKTVIPSGSNNRTSANTQDPGLYT
ncbi:MULTISPECIES: phage holin family protein [Corynebacterium]|uniref:phage holin family protein n=1 Tax=Corynebacterium TaxID=1716 RepID=UPI001883DFCD|nr:phage holin family protein [Corynebacterium dentalis]MBF0581601.1 phage holin family protein [Corynebacterium sp. ED61]